MPKATFKLKSDGAAKAVVWTANYKQYDRIVSGTLSFSEDDDVKEFEVALDNEDCFRLIEAHDLILTFKHKSTKKPIKKRASKLIGVYVTPDDVDLEDDDLLETIATRILDDLKIDHILKK